jgi:glycerophosphoryl diester phosphodiesterase
MAHRGMMREAPENTAGALGRCIEEGIEWAEVDVRLTRDGQHVLFHDARLERKTDGSGSVREHTLAEMLALDAGAKFSTEARGTRLLTAVEALELARGRLNLCFDCKDADPERLAREIMDAGMERQVVVFDGLEALRRVRAASGGSVPLMPKWRTRFGLMPWVEEVRPEAVEVNADELTAEVARVLDMGADWLQTDRALDLIVFERDRSAGLR